MSRTVLAMCLLMLLGGCGRGPQGKHPADLTDSERGALDRLLMEIYQRSFELREFQPFVGFETRIHPATKKRLGRSIQTIGAIPKHFSLNVDDPLIQRIIDRNVKNISVTWQEGERKHRLSIIEYAIDTFPGEVEPSPGVVVICPFKVKVE